MICQGGKGSETRTFESINKRNSTNFLWLKSGESFIHVFILTWYKNVGNTLKSFVLVFVFVEKEVTIKVANLASFCISNVTQTPLYRQNHNSLSAIKKSFLSLQLLFSQLKDKSLVLQCLSLLVYLCRGVAHNGIIGRIHFRKIKPTGGHPQKVIFLTILID